MPAGASYWIEKLGLEKHPEGGYFTSSYRSTEWAAKECLPDRYSGPRVFSSAIYYLLEKGAVCALHRIKSDETWHFYEGSPLALYVIDAAGKLCVRKLGRDFGAGELFQVTVAQGCWFGAVVDGPQDYSLLGCTVSPGFDYEDFELARRDELTARHPEYRQIIEILTREP
jgi:uncharacterized protein